MMDHKSHPIGGTCHIVPFLPEAASIYCDLFFLLKPVALSNICLMITFFISKCFILKYFRIGKFAKVVQKVHMHFLPVSLILILIN